MTALDSDENTSDGAEINVQSATTQLTHQPGAIYEGNSGFAGQILLINDFTDASYIKTDASDSVGYVTAVKVIFPAGNLTWILLSYSGDSRSSRDSRDSWVNGLKVKFW